MGSWHFYIEGLQIQHLKIETHNLASSQSAIDVSEVALGAGTNGADTDKSFTRVTLGMDIDINSNIDSLVLGEGNRDDYSGSQTSDINFSNISLGTIGSNGTIQDFQMSDPYIEFSRNNIGELIGFRLGFGEANGTLGLDINTLSGDIESVGEIDLGLFDLPVTTTSNETRSTEVEAIGILTLPLDGFHRLEVEGTNNMYIGLQSQAINYPKIGDGPQGTAQAGFWLNLQDGVTVPDLSFSLTNPSNSHPVNSYF